MQVRRADFDDAQAIAGIHTASWRDAYARLLPRSYLVGLQERSLDLRWRRTIVRQHRKPEQVWVAIEDGEVLGFAHAGASRHRRGWSGRAGELYMLYVSPSATGRGAGRALFHAAASDLAARHMYWLHVWVLADNRRAQRFYEAQGLRQDGAQRVDHFDEVEVEVDRYAMALNPVCEGLFPE